MFLHFYISKKNTLDYAVTMLGCCYAFSKVLLGSWGLLLGGCDTVFLEVVYAGLGMSFKNKMKAIVFF